VAYVGLVWYVRFVPVCLSVGILRCCGDIESRRGLTNTSALFPHSPPYFCNPIQPPTLANSQPSTDDRSPANSQKLAIPLPQPCRVRGSNPILAPLSAVAFVRFAWFVHRWAISPLCRLKLRSAQNNLEPMIDNDSFLLPFTYWERIPNGRNK
jgi:hypothetical protein